MESSARREARFDDPRQLSVTLAATDRDVDAAQRLRYRVFAGEMGARLSGPAAGRDEDEFDAWCEHLIVRDDRCGEVVGTYRVLTADRAARLGSFYADTEFDLSRLAPLRPGMCEIGRACIHPDYRDGGAIMLLWQGLAALMQERRCRTLIGCASIAMDDGGANALRVWRRLARTHLAPDANRVGVAETPERHRSRRADEPGHAPDGRGLPRAVGADQASHSPGSTVEGHSANAAAGAELSRQVTNAHP